MTGNVLAHFSDLHISIHQCICVLIPKILQKFAKDYTEFITVAQIKLHLVSASKANMFSLPTRHHTNDWSGCPGVTF